MAYPIISIILFSVAGVITYLFVVGFIWGAGYYPTSKREIMNAGDLLDPKPGSTIYDLGCGFGKVVINLARKYPQCSFIGVDIDPIKTFWCNLAVKQKGLGERVKIVRGNILSVDLSNASGVFIFLTEETKIMDCLREKMFRELKAGSRVASYIHKFRGWQSIAQKGGVRLYEVPSNAKQLQEMEASR